MQLNTIWPKWNLVEQIGEGSFGKVYKVVREEHGITDYSAVKVITIPQSPAELNSLRADGYDETSARSYFESIVTDFVNEIKLMVTMKGTANIVSVEDYKVVERTGEIGWDIYIRMELLTSLLDYTAGRKLSQDETIRLGQDMCCALELCSRKKIIHRDIKPENIFVSSFGSFKIGDFGIARELEKTSGSMSAKGTYNYIAPEVANSKSYNATVDIYSLGLVLYKLLNNNRLPFIDPYAVQIQYQDKKNAIDRRLSGEPLPSPVEASPEMAHIILKACRYDPSQRFLTATEFKKALEAVKNGKYEIVSFSEASHLLDDMSGTITGRPAAADFIEESGTSGGSVFIQNGEDGFNITGNKTNEKSKHNKIAVILTGVACACIIAIVAIILPYLSGNNVSPQPSSAPEQSHVPASPVLTPSVSASPVPASPEPAADNQAEAPIVPDNATIISSYLQVLENEGPPLYHSYEWGRVITNGVVSVSFIDVNGDGIQEMIYSRLVDRVRWDVLIYGFDQGNCVELLKIEGIEYMAGAGDFGVYSIKGGGILAFGRNGSENELYTLYYTYSDISLSPVVKRFDIVWSEWNDRGEYEIITFYIDGVVVTETEFIEQENEMFSNLEFFLTGSGFSTIHIGTADISMTYEDAIFELIRDLTGT